MLANLPLVPNLKMRFNINELQVLHFLQNYGYIINEEKGHITANNKFIDCYINVSAWWAEFIAACHKINTAYRQANSKNTNASINLTYSEAAALFKVIMRVNWDREDTYAQIVIYSVIEKLNRYLC